MAAKTMAYIRYNPKAWFFKWEICKDFEVRTGQYGDVECETVIVSRHTSYNRACKLYQILHGMAIKHV